MTQINFRLLGLADLESYRRIRLECLTNYPDYFGDSHEEEINADPSKFVMTFLLDNDHSFLNGAFSHGLEFTGLFNKKEL